MSRKRKLQKAFILGYMLYRYAEYSHWAQARKNPKDYANEKPPPPPTRICRRLKEPTPFCKKDWEYEEYECAEGEEPDAEFAKILQERNNPE